MKTTFILLLTTALFVSCKKEEPKSELYPEAAETQTPMDLGKEIFNGKGNCFACHREDQKVIGPSIQEIAKTYKAKKGNLVQFLKENADPLVDPSQYDAMKVNLQLTKTFSEEELKGLEAYIYSF
ncbi:c-type cytochrome [Flavobacterium pallidum]|uniref:Cytochrome C552 n=1 Tax=Flavobacterium pallidum TaxID=2172098 RepID=A0A2S1SF15_9FLAO|nr:c-type cytochrome [Flavobacterium pallidum]AWI25006.1 cytochrome C552 [Flavobacterium pallidum]